MTQQATEEIEVEVLEVDGVAPVPAQASTAGDATHQGDWQDWRQWQGRVRKLDNRWWPLWALLGIIAFVLLITVGLVIGAVYLVARVIQGFLRAIFR